MMLLTHGIVLVVAFHQDQLDRTITHLLSPELLHMMLECIIVSLPKTKSLLDLKILQLQ